MNESPTNVIERKIEGVLGLEGLSPQDFSRILFGFGGLFNELAAAVGDRKAVVQSALFQRANDRLSELEDDEIASLDRPRPLPNGDNGPARTP